MTHIRRVHHYTFIYIPIYVYIGFMTPCDCFMCHHVLLFSSWYHGWPTLHSSRYIHVNIFSLAKKPHHTIQYHEKSKAHVYWAWYWAWVIILRPILVEYCTALLNDLTNKVTNRIRLVDQSNNVQVTFKHLMLTCHNHKLTFDFEINI